MYYPLFSFVVLLADLIHGQVDAVRVTPALREAFGQALRQQIGELLF